MIELLARPYSGRWIAGVCAGVQNAYGVPVWLVRVTLIVAFFAAPIVLLLYLLFAIAMPSERSVAGDLFFRTAIPHAAGFSTTATYLLDRTAGRIRSMSSRQRTIVPALFLLTLVFGLPKLEGTMFYVMHPMFDWLLTTAGRVASSVAYALVGLAFIVRASDAKRAVAVAMNRREEFALEATEYKSIGGVAIAISRATAIDVSVVRVLLLLLNFLTIGVVGAIYFFTVWLMRHRIYRGEDGVAEKTLPRNAPLTNFNVIMAALFLLLALVRISTEFRWFFFNEPFVRGLLLAIAGVVLSRRAEPLAILAGAALLFFGVLDITTALFHVQPDPAARWIIKYVILAIAILYYALIALKDNGRTVALAFAAVPLVAAVLIMTHLVSEPFLMALGRFYEFFSPLIFSALALWVAMES